MARPRQNALAWSAVVADGNPLSGERIFLGSPWRGASVRVVMLYDSAERAIQLGENLRAIALRSVQFFETLQQFLFPICRQAMVPSSPVTGTVCLVMLPIDDVAVRHSEYFLEHCNRFTEGTSDKFWTRADQTTRGQQDALKTTKVAPFPTRGDVAPADIVHRDESHRKTRDAYAQFSV